ncbi:hypothetical protein PLICRDRAFT_123446 [Plicaturopsis crispa FD-325 SS-3]|nr:hypothetical protein PLICRDRAFT_123446 [Plicaturopsis crispa FD-325 SS-3]
MTSLAARPRPAIPFKPIHDIPNTSSSSTQRWCSTCNKPIPLAQVLKTCAMCREKDKKKREKIAKRKADGVDAHAIKRVKLEPKDASNANTLHDGVVKMQQEAHAEEITRFDASKNEYAAPAPYQNASRLLDELRLRANTCAVVFSGTYSLVANPKIDNARRIELVAREVRKIAKYTYDHKAPLALDKTDGDSCATQCFRCTCSSGGPSVKLTSVLTTKGPSDLSRWFAKPVPIPTAHGHCGGTVRIRAEDDASHPLGIKGQKVTVWIQHPE